MSSPDILNKKKLTLFTIVHSLSGVVFGVNISLFNMIDREVLKNLAQNGYQKNKFMVNLFFCVGGILACIVSGAIIRKYPRRYLNLYFLVANIGFTLLQLIPWNFFICFFRFLIGFISVFYTFISPISFKEYLPRNLSSRLGSFFYVGVSAGIFYSFLIGCQVKSTSLAKFLIVSPIFIEFIRLLILVRCFHCESPRFTTFRLLEENPTKLKLLEKRQSVDYSSRNSTLDLTQKFFNLQEDDEDILKESFIGDSITSMMSLTRDSKLQNDTFENSQIKLKLFIKKNDQIQNYLHIFYSENQRELAFEDFFNEFIKVYHKELLSSKIFSLDLLKLLLHKNYRLQIFVLALLNFLNQMTGVNCLIFYSRNLLRAMKFNSHIQMLNVLISKFYFLFLIDQVFSIYWEESQCSLLLTKLEEEV
jgi:hypothetical protein